VVANLLGVWTPARLVLFPLLLAGSAMVISALMLIAASGCFWVKNSYSILAFISSFRDHTRYPMDIYNALFKFFFTWILPVGFIAFYPSTFFLRDTPLDWTAFASPAVGIVVFVIAVKVWDRGIAVWGGTGS
jgi:ABC-2 type transport system permease protein